MQKTIFAQAVNLKVKAHSRAMAVRSRVQMEHSNSEFKKAVERLNLKWRTQKAVFVLSPLVQTSLYSSSQPMMLWEIGKKGKTDDDLFAERKIECGRTFDELRETTAFKYSAELCYLASIWHPNVAGSRAIADAAKNSLTPFWEKLRANR